MNNRFVQLVGLAALGYGLFWVVRWSLIQVSYLLGDMASWLRWGVVPRLFGIAVAVATVWFVWQLLFGKDD
ncbi:MAG: hypothetical protein NZ772_03780 [Cyanobacteria bacterium]|nr:hypothetical protein [Cyanobacteriota bacterium]MDW8200567.1 hypothetical protein [Cyanobacteriota bacterium SKYGB_h_bin112]